MSTPFRDLFHELSAELFEAIKGIGGHRREQAVPQAAHVALCERYQWSSVIVRPRADLDCTEVIATLECGHRVHYPLDDRRLPRAQDIVDALDRLVDCFPRRCFCTPRPERL